MTRMLMQAYAAGPLPDSLLALQFTGSPVAAPMLLIGPPLSRIGTPAAPPLVAHPSP